MDRFCRKTVGLASTGIATRVEAHVGGVVSEAGVRVAKSGCEGNLLVIFTADTDDFARRINSTNPWLMADTASASRG